MQKNWVLNAGDWGTNAINTRCCTIGTTGTRELKVVSTVTKIFIASMNPKDKKNQLFCVYSSYAGLYAFLATDYKDTLCSPILQSSIIPFPLLDSLHIVEEEANGSKYDCKIKLHRVCL